MKDAKFLSGEFFEKEIPPDKRYLLHYFDPGLQETFLRFYFTFGDFTSFTDFTGQAVTVRYLRKLEKRLNLLIQTREDAQKNFDLDTVWKIDSGKLKVTHLKGWE